VRSLRPHASGFDPRVLSGCICNLDASVLSSLKQNSNGTTDATATNDPIGYWADLSGLGNNAVQTVATGSRPFLKLDNQNGRPGLLFDGSNDWLTTTIPGLQSLSAVTVVQIFKTSAAAAANTNAGIFWGFGNVGAASGSFPSARALALGSSSADISNETVTALVDISGTSGRLGSSTYARAANAAQMLATTMSSSGTSVLSNNLSVTLNLSNNVTTTTAAGPSNTGYTVDNDFHIGALRVGGSIVVGPSWTLHQHVIYNRALSLSELATLWNALGRKWGV
jgi:hypothetical protein